MDGVAFRGSRADGRAAGQTSYLLEAHAITQGDFHHQKRLLKSADHFDLDVFPLNAVGEREIVSHVEVTRKTAERSLEDDTSSSLDSNIPSWSAVVASSRD